MMAINRNESIVIPVWLIGILLPIIISIVVSYGVMTAGKATLDERSVKNAFEIETLKQNKVDRNEMNLIILSLTRIEGKLDEHISKPNATLEQITTTLNKNNVTTN